MAKLTEKNYYDLTVDNEYMSCHQLANWHECAAREAARLRGEYKPPFRKYFLVGSYVDCALTTPNKFDSFVEKNRSNIFGRGDKKYADFVVADKIIARLRNEELANNLIGSGDNQTVLVGEIGGVPFKGLADIVNHDVGIIADLKTAKTFDDGWLAITDDCGNVRNQKVAWYEVWNYWRQLAVYQELNRQMTGDIYDAYIIAATKEDVPDMQCILFDNMARLQREVDAVTELVIEAQMWKTGEIEPPACGKCDYCKPRKKLTVEVATSIY